MFAKLALQNFFDAFAPHYDSFYELIDYAAWAAIIQSELEALLPAPRLILEAGCGTGAMLYELAKHSEQSCVGVDISAGMLDICRNRLRHEHNVKLVQSDLFALGFQSECFDAVVGSFSLLNFFSSNQRKALLTEMWRVLKPNGIFLTDYFTAQRYEQLLQASANGANTSHKDSSFSLSQIFPVPSPQTAPSFDSQDRLKCERILRIAEQTLSHPLYFLDPQEIALDFSAAGFHIVKSISLVRDSSSSAPNRLTLIGRKLCPSSTSKSSTSASTNSGSMKAARSTFPSSISATTFSTITA